jgi:hypothetical protein
MALVLVIALTGTAAWAAPPPERISVASLLKEMVDFETLAQKPQPFFKEATASSYSRESHKGGEAWFDNRDVGQYVRTESSDNRKEHVLADLKGPGTITRFWSANPTFSNAVRFYFDGEHQPRLELPLADLFKAEKPPFSPAFSYISGTGGNLYFPLPYSSSLKITIEEIEKPVRLYYEIGYRSYEPGTEVETFDPRDAASWELAAAETSRALSSPEPAPVPDGSQWLTQRLTIRPGKTQSLPEVTGEKALYEWSAQVLEARESPKWDDPKQAHNTYRFILLDISFDGESFPSTFGTGTEDDYGFAYGYNGTFTRPYHAQTRVDGPWSGGHISLNRWYVLDALPYRTGIRFDQEMWHWMPCRPTWSHVIYWYAKPGTPGPREIDRAGLAPQDLGVRENMIEPFEGEVLAYEAAGGTAAKERLANCAGAEHLVWRGARQGDKLTVHFAVAKAGRYSIELNLCQSPDYGRQRFCVNGNVVRQVVDGYSPKLYWLHAKLGVFDLKAGDNVLIAEALEPNPKARPGNLFGLDYVFLIRQ